MTREELDELDIIIRDLRMAMDIKNDIENGTINPIAQFADGEKIVLRVPQSVKDQIDNKIIELTDLINNKRQAIELKEAVRR